MSKVLGVTRSGYYAWRKRGPSNRSIENQRLTAEVKQIFEQSNRSYGSPRITEALRERDWSVSRPRVARLMRKNGIRVKPKPRFVPTTDSEHDEPICPNLLNRAFEPGKINRAWVSDITYVPTREGWLYLTTVMDLGDRRIIGWATSSDMSAQQTSIKAFKMARDNRKPDPKTLFHSDRGIQYAAKAFRKLLSDSNISQQSMSRKGNCWDNAVAESFFKTFKSEAMGKRPFESREKAQKAIFQYIEIWYNRKRLHSALGYKTPKEYLKSIL